MKVGSYVSQLDTSYKQVPTLKGGAYKYMRIVNKSVTLHNASQG